MRTALRILEHSMILCALALCSLAARADGGEAEGWEKVSADPAPVPLWISKPADKPYHLVRADVVIAAPIFQLLGILQDPKSQSQWLPHTHQVALLEQPSPHQTLVRFQSESRWPIKARDAVTLFEVSQPAPDRLHIAMHNRPDAVPVQPDVVRIRQAEGYWELTALNNCRTRVRYQAGSHWGGSIPQWLVNRMNRDIAVEALTRLQQWAPAQTHYNQPSIHLQPVPRHAQCS